MLGTLAVGSADAAPPLDTQETKDIQKIMSTQEIKGRAVKQQGGSGQCGLPQSTTQIDKAIQPNPCILSSFHGCHGHKCINNAFAIGMIALDLDIEELPKRCEEMLDFHLTTVLWEVTNKQ